MIYVETTQKYMLSHVKSSQKVWPGTKSLDQKKKNKHIFKDFRNCLKEFINIKVQSKKIHSVPLIDNLKNYRDAYDLKTHLQSIFEYFKC